MKPVWTPTHDEALQKYHARGLTDYEIADRMQCDGYPFRYRTVRKHRVDLGLRPNLIPLAPGWNKSGGLPVFKPDPLEVAEYTLNGFNRSTMTLNGRVVRLDEVMQLVNKVRKQMGEAQITPNPNWEYRG